MTGLFGLFRHFDCFAVLSIKYPSLDRPIDPNLDPSIARHGHGKMIKNKQYENKQTQVQQSRIDEMMNMFEYTLPPVLPANGFWNMSIRWQEVTPRLRLS